MRSGISPYGDPKTMKVSAKSRYLQRVQQNHSSMGGLPKRPTQHLSLWVCRYVGHSLRINQKLIVLANVEAFFLIGFGYAQGQNHVGYFQQQE